MSKMLITWTVIQCVKKGKMKRSSRVPMFFLKGTVIWTEGKSEAGKSVSVLCHKDSESFRTNELAVLKCVPLFRSCKAEGSEERTSHDKT